jgi:CheY-like chemotaxis protein
MTAPVAVNQPLQHARVLVADDDRELRRSLARAIAVQGGEVDEARDGSSLRSMLRGAVMFPGDEPDWNVVVSDIDMPGASGLDVLEEFGALLGRRRFILVSGRVDETVRRRAQAAGAYAVLEKPFELPELLGMVGQVARLR